MSHGYDSFVSDRAEGPVIWNTPFYLSRRKWTVHFYRELLLSGLRGSSKKVSLGTVIHMRPILGSFESGIREEPSNGPHLPRLKDKLSLTFIFNRPYPTDST